MTLADGLTREHARHIVHRMGETGQPPERGALLVNVGTEAYLEILQNEYLKLMRETGRNSSFKLVQAPFGGGKTHFLHCLREIGWQEGFATALVGLSPKECPFDKSLKIYQEVAAKIELPPQTSDKEPERGIDIALRAIAEERREKLGASAFGEWLRSEFERSSVESRALRKAMRLFLEAVLSRDLEAEDVLGAYLLGKDVDAGEIKPFRLRERLDDSNAFKFLRSLVQAIAALGVPGIVLMFDEMDRNMSLSVRRRREIGDNLRQMIDHCGQSTLPNVLWCYAVPPEFMDTIVPEYPALAQRLKGAAQFSEQSPLQPIIDLDRLPLDAARLFEGIGGKLLGVYERGFELRFERGVQGKNMHALAREVGANQLESGSRRQFVKAAVALLDDQHRAGERPLTLREVERFARSGAAGAEPGEMEGEQGYF